MKVAVLAVLMLFATSAKADTMHHVDASGSFAGGAVSFNSAFDWNVTTNSLSQGTMTFSSFGFTGFSLTGITHNLANWGDQLGNHIQIDFARLGYTGESFNRGGVYDSFWMELWCGSLHCLDGIATTGDSGNNFLLASSGGITITPIATPEPATYALLLLGLLLLYVLFCYNQKVGNVVQLVRGKWYGND